MKNINIIVPQYQSSYCVDDCSYCGFKKSNRIIDRTRLSDEDFKKEIEILVDLGYRTIEFVYASDKYFNASRIAKRVEYVKNYGKKKQIDIRVGLNSEPLDFKGYKILYDAGLDFFVIWMETYNKDKYIYWHGKKTPKANFERRYNSYEIAIEAGLKNYGMGILFGLSKWQEDVNALIKHGRKLTQKYNVSPYIIGVPRIKRANCVIIDNKFEQVTDENLKIAIEKYNEAFPEAMIFFNTRENFEFNVETCKENDLFTIDCGTYPGAYLNPSILKNDTEQFHTFQYNRGEVIKQLRNNGFKIQYEW